MFTYNVKVFYEDTDSGGVVYYANYLKFIERARTDLIHQLSFSLNKLNLDFGVLFVVKRIECDYLISAKLEDELLVKTNILKVKNASFILEQNIERDTKSIFTSKVLMVCIDSNGKPKPIPIIVSKKMSEFYEKNI